MERHERNASKELDEGLHGGDTGDACVDDEAKVGRCLGQVENFVAHEDRTLPAEQAHGWARSRQTCKKPGATNFESNVTLMPVWHRPYLHVAQ